MNQIKKTFFKIFSLFRPITLIYASVFVLLTILLFISAYSLPVEKAVEPKEDYFGDLQLKAKAVYVFDSKENRVLFEKNARVPLPLASITKLMSVHCALKSLNKEDFIVVPDKVYSYNDKATSTGATELWRVRDLAIYTLITSSNTGANVLSQYAGGLDENLLCMNNEALRMNIFETSFNNVTGLDIDDNTPGAVGSAENVATMLQYIYSENMDIVNKTAFENFNIYSKNGIIHKAENTNIITDKITGFLGSKTGLTDIAGGNIAFVMDVGLNHKIFITILGSTEEGRFEDALMINNTIIRSFSN